MAFLPGFTEPTLALLYAPEWTWSGRLEHLAHNYLVSLVTLTTTTTTSSTSGGASTRATVISTSPPLPYSCQHLTACPPAIGGVLLTTANGLLHLDQSGRVVAAPANGWLARDYPPGRARPPGLDAPQPANNDDERICEKLEGARVAFVSHAADSDDDDAHGDAGGGGAAAVRALVWCPSGAVLALTFELAGRSVAALHLSRVADAARLSGAGATALVRVKGGARSRGGTVFVASESAACALVRWRYAGEGAAGGEEGEAARAAAGEDAQREEAAQGDAQEVVQVEPARRERHDDEVEMDFDEDGASDLPPLRPLAPSLRPLASSADSHDPHRHLRRLVSTKRSRSARPAVHLCARRPRRSARRLVERERRGRRRAQH